MKKFVLLVISLIFTGTTFAGTQGGLECNVLVRAQVSASSYSKQVGIADPYTLFNSKAIINIGDGIEVSKGVFFYKEDLLNRSVVSLSLIDNCREEGGLILSVRGADQDKFANKSMLFPSSVYKDVVSEVNGDIITFSSKLSDISLSVDKANKLLKANVGELKLY